jgi:hypothetical protein
MNLHVVKTVLQPFRARNRKTTNRPVTAAAIGEPSGNPNSTPCLHQGLLPFMLPNIGEQYLSCQPRIMPRALNISTSLWPQQEAAPSAG